MSTIYTIETDKRLGEGYSHFDCCSKGCLSKFFDDFDGLLELTELDYVERYGFLPSRCAACNLDLCTIEVWHGLQGTNFGIYVKYREVTKFTTSVASVAVDVRSLFEDARDNTRVIRYTQKPAF